MRRIIWSMSVSLDGYMEGTRPRHLVECHRRRAPPALQRLAGTGERFPDRSHDLRVDGCLLAHRRPRARRVADHRGVRGHLAHDSPRSCTRARWMRSGDNAALKREVDPDAVLALKEQGAATCRWAAPGWVRSSCAWVWWTDPGVRPPGRDRPRHTDVPTAGRDHVGGS